ncbi:hypothetical protein ES702_00552 [subsurface metagenome]
MSEILGPAAFKKLVKQVAALENITLTKLFKKIKPSDDSMKIQYGGVLIAFNPYNDEEIKVVKQFFDHLIATKEGEK